MYFFLPDFLRLIKLRSFVVKRLVSRVMSTNFVEKTKIGIHAEMKVVLKMQNVNVIYVIGFKKLNMFFWLFKLPYNEEFYEVFDVW